MKKNLEQEAQEQQTEQEAQEQQTEQEMPEYDPWQDMRQVYVPSMSRGEQKTLQVGVNDKTYFVPKDKFVDVPAPVAEVVNEMLERRKIMEENAKAASGVHETAIG